uniref:Sosondowah ankyrin repeat domain family member B n=1 Tax=Nothobranchius furzeri TaxID=105023 RepID=A0A1A8U5L5_NOTFU
MATDFTQDSVLLFLRSSGGSVRNADLLLHFRPFLQDPANRDRNRELFKKFVNALAIVKQVDGVSHVFLRKKFRGPGAGPDPPEPSVVNPALPSETGRETVLPAAGLKVTTTNPTETTQKLVNTSLEPGIRPVPASSSHQDQEPLLHPQQVPARRRFRYRPSYKSAVSQDGDDEEDEEEVEEVPGGQWTQSVPLFVTDRSISPSFTSIGSPSSPSSSSGRPVPQICIQQDPTPLGPSEVSSEPEADSVPVEVQLHSAVVRRLSTRLMGRMCRSLSTDLDQILQDEGVGGGNDAARLNRLHRISSSLSLSLNRSASSLSSQPTSNFYSSSVQMGGEDRRHVRRSLTSISSHHEESQVPLDAREHAWMVKAAAGAWTDIYSLFREDKDLLNKPDFISGFTVLHWIAKHGDHRVLNTLWYGVEKVGMNFNINAKSRAGQTPLHVAAIHGHKNVIRLLVSSFKANVTLRDTAGKKPWQYLSNSSPDMLELLKAPRRYGGTTEDSSWSAPPPPPPQQRRRLQHHFSSASSGLKQSTKVKRSTSIAAFLKNKALTHF